jgi:hypothetical protein
MSDYYAAIANLIRSNAPAKFARATIECFWFTGVIKGPAVSYFDASGARVLSGWPIGVQRELSRLFHLNSEAERKRLATPAGDLPNVFGFEILGDGGFSERWTYDPEAQAKEDARLRLELGNSEYERLQQPPTPRAPPPPAAINNEAEPTSVPELLAFIQQELAKDVPAGWKTLRVEGEVWQEDGIDHIKSVYYYTVPNDEQRRPFSASNVYGPMNAVRRLQQAMASEGNVWRKVQIAFTAGTTRTLIDTQ